MKNQFEDVMSKRLDQDLLKIVNSLAGDYQPEAVLAAHEEIKKRKSSFREKISILSDNQILEILKSKMKFTHIEIIVAEEEAQNRNLDFIKEDVKAENTIEEVENNNFGVIHNRYPVLRFISDTYKILAWIILFATGIIVLNLLSEEVKIGLPIVVGIILIGCIIFISLLALAEGIRVFIDIEHNTRLTAQKTKKTIN